MWMEAGGWVPGAAHPRWRWEVAPSKVARAVHSDGEGTGEGALLRDEADQRRGPDGSAHAGVWPRLQA